MELDTYEYLLIEPHLIRKIIKKVNFTKDKKQALVTPVMAGICGSDVLYFRGDKDYLKLQQRLPIVPLHEGVVQIQDSKTFAGIIPFNKCNLCSACLNGMENLCENNSYMGSTAPGLARSCFTYPSELIINIPETVTLKLAVLLEPASIVYRMMQETEINTSDSIAVIGSGTMGRLMVIFLSLFKGVDKDRLFLLSRSDAIALKFKDLCQTLNSSTQLKLIADLKNEFSLVIEAVGGAAMGYTLEQAISLVRPGGAINILGLADAVNQVNFTNIVTKGIRLRGFSRARHNDYFKMMKVLSENSYFRSLLEHVIDRKEFLVRDENDLMDAFHYASSGNNDGRVIVSFQASELRI